MDFSKLTAFLDGLTFHTVPGNDCIVYQNHKQIFRHMSGYSNLENKVKISGNELYNMWSASKVITCAAALTLYEKGLFSLSDPLYEYMPEFKKMYRKKLLSDKTEELVPVEKDITILNLFTMTAGFTYNINTPYIKDARQKSNNRCPTREIARAIASSPLIFEPGTHWNYSLCHDVLGALIEVVSGMRFADYAEKAIFGPLEMNSSTYKTPAESEMHRMATQYSYRKDLGRFITTNNSCGYKLGPDYDSGGAGVVSSASDYIKFADAMANGGIGINGEKILNPSTINLMKKNALDEICLSEFSQYYLQGYGYGLGVRTLMDPKRAGSKGCAGEFGWNGAAGAIVIIDPENELSVFYAQHMLDGDEKYMFSNLRDTVYDCIKS